LIFIDFVFLIPYVKEFEINRFFSSLLFLSYLILLTALIREKNAKVKEILKILGIEPTLNNFAQAIR